MWEYPKKLSHSNKLTPAHLVFTPVKAYKMSKRREMNFLLFIFDLKSFQKLHPKLTCPAVRYIFGKNKKSYICIEEYVALS